MKFLGFRVFYHHKLLRKANIRKMKNRLAEFRRKYRKGAVAHRDIMRSLESWTGYARQGNTYRLRQRILKDCARTRARQACPF